MRLLWNKANATSFDSERKFNLFDRANHFRQNNEYDKAAELFEQILSNDTTDAEVYWSLVLCRYGIEYVEDPSSHKRVPTVNRAQFTPVFSDDDYKSAIEHADTEQRVLYESEAKAIDEIQKGILAISKEEEPFDIFICYKETDFNGRRTLDSVLATDIYNQLTKEGYKVFFSRITLEDKLGVAYEPYIFSALNSSKAMIVIGTKTEYFNAVWVRNEWSRYLALIRGGANKVLIPAYRDMDPYDLPGEFAHLQAQDLSKLGYMQDLVHGLKKIVTPKVAEEKNEVSNNSIVVAPLLKRAKMFLQEGDFGQADACYEKALDLDPECADAYLGKLLVELKLDKPEDLNNCEQSFSLNKYYLKFVQFSKTENKITDYAHNVDLRIENNIKQTKYDNACTQMGKATSEKKWLEVADLFHEIIDYHDADLLEQQCHEKAEKACKDKKRKTRLLVSLASGIFAVSIAVFLFLGFSKKWFKQWTCEHSIVKRLTEESTCCTHGTIELVCSKCGKIFETYAAPFKEHNYSVWMEIKASSCIEEGEMTRTCRVCGHIDKKSISKKEHTYVNWTVSKEPSCTEEGEETGVCSICGVTVKQSVSKINHDYYGMVCAGCGIHATIGEVVKFGSYEQDNNTKNGKESIEWIVLDIVDNKAFLISVNLLDMQQYDSYSGGSGTWATCSLRKWLNGTFLNTAFNNQEKAMIQLTKVLPDSHPKYSTNQGNATNDKVYLLSFCEYDKYKKIISGKECEPTLYSQAKSIYSYYKEEFGIQDFWYLRTLTDYPYVSVGLGGSVSECSMFEGYFLQVRPVLWISIHS